MLDRVGHGGLVYMFKTQYAATDDRPEVLSLWHLLLPSLVICNFAGGAPHLHLIINRRFSDFLSDD